MNSIPPNQFKGTRAFRELSANSLINRGIATALVRNCNSIVSFGANRCDHVLFTSGRVGNYSMFCAYANGACDGFYSGTFFNRSDVGKGNCFVIYCGVGVGTTGRALTICF